jgi:hypothetical protein
LNLYGFELINTGPARGGYYHELFVKERSEMCRRMRRVAVKVNPKGESSSDKKEDDKPEESSEEQPPIKEEERNEAEKPVEVNLPEPSSIVEA